MADKRSGNATGVPQSASMPKVASKVSGISSIDHYLDGAPIEEVDSIRVVGTTEVGIQSAGFAEDFTDPVSLPTAAAGTKHGLNGTTALAALRAGQAIGIVRLTTNNVAGRDAVMVRGNTTAPCDSPLPAFTASQPPNTNKRFWYTARVSIVDGLADGAVFIGLATNALADVDAEPADGVYFYLANAGSDFKFVVRKNSTSTTLTTTVFATAGVTLAAATFFEFSFRIDDAGVIYAYLNGILVATLAGGNANTPYTPSSGQLCIAIGRSTQSANARNLDVDYYLCSQET